MSQENQKQSEINQKKLIKININKIEEKNKTQIKKENVINQKEMDQNGNNRKEIGHIENNINEIEQIEKKRKEIKSININIKTIEQNETNSNEIKSKEDKQSELNQNEPNQIEIAEKSFLIHPIISKEDEKNKANQDEIKSKGNEKNNTNLKKEEIEKNEIIQNMNIINKKFKEEQEQTNKFKNKEYLKEINIIELEKNKAIMTKDDDILLENELENNKDLKLKNKLQDSEYIKNEEIKSDKVGKKNINIKNNNIIVKKISFHIIGKEKIPFLITSNSLLIKKNKKKNNQKKIENNVFFSILPEEECLEEDELAYLSKISPKGLLNIGGICYMNATLQCFYHIEEFTDYFLKNKKYIKKKGGLISLGLLDVIEGLSKKSKDNYYVPEQFKKNLIEKDKSFKGNEGKDSGDLVFIILSSCQDELSKFSDFQDMSLDQREQSQIFLDVFYKNLQAPSIIMELFSYYVRIENICFECGTKFYSIDIENLMIFSLEKVFRLTAPDITIKDGKRVVSVENCLSCFSFDGSFEKRRFTCRYCKKISNLFTVRSFATLPKYLIMIMKRGKNEKFECNVNFEEKLELAESYYPVKGVPKEKNTKYDLLGGTILYGSKGYGHTVAFCRHFDGEYYIFDDSSFKKTNYNKIKNLKIYLLFYKKTNE